MLDGRERRNAATKEERMREKRTKTEDEEERGRKAA